MRFFIRLFILILTLAAAMGAGYALGLKKPQGNAVTASATQDASATTGKGKVLYYRNPMGLPDTSPVPKQDSMGMDYVPVYENEAAQEPGAVRVSAERVQRLGVKTEIVERRTLSHVVRAVGTVQIDETRQTVIAPRFEGWVEKLLINATGQYVKKGDALFTIYSPQIIQTETEYLSATSATSSAAQGKSGSLARLVTLAVPDEEIDRLKRERKVNSSIVMRSPADGTVMEKLAIEGMKFSPGDKLYRLVDLSSIWVISDVFEQDLMKIEVGQNAKISFAVFPERVFEGKVSFIYPDINPATRTAKIRIELANADGKLRTDMYGSAELEAAHSEPVLTVTASALLNNGQTKAVLLDRGEGLYQPQTVKIGLTHDGYTEVLEGLSEGDRVVTSASFLIDAESNIRAALQNFTQRSEKP